MGPEATFNFWEAWFWIALAVLYILLCFRKQAHRKLCLTTTLVFFVFGLTDFVEMKTGAWYRPWWLLLWKGACVVGLIALYCWYKAIIHSKVNRSSDSNQ